jgi:hypothetical protein
MRGVPLNAYDSKASDLILNEEFKLICQILGLPLGVKHREEPITYKKIVLANDADCLHKNTLIDTKTGAKKIKDVNIGEEVLTHTGAYKPVINVIEKRFQKCVVVKINGDYITMSENHHIYVIRDNNIELIKASELKETDFLIRRK